jgi:hypothetical protein
MPIALVIIGVFLLVAAVRWNSGGNQVWTLLQSDLQGKSVATGKQSGSFFAWAAAIILIGAVGYVDELKPVANTMLALVIVVLLLSNNGFFAQLQKDITTKPSATNTTASTAGATQLLGTALGAL